MKRSLRNKHSDLADFVKIVLNFIVGLTVGWLFVKVSFGIQEATGINALLAGAGLLTALCLVVLYFAD